MRKGKGFTLLELMIVIIILGVLATLGVMQYQAAIEKSRGAEARQVIGQLRSHCAALYMANGNTTGCTVGNLGISSAATIEDGKIPGTTCWGTHFFRYGISVAGAGGTITLQATRCIVGGKNPTLAVTSAPTLTLAINYATGGDTWDSTGGY